MSVTEPSQINLAIEIIEKALERAPAQEARASQKIQGLHRPLQRYVSLDAEFKWVQLNDEDLNRELGKTSVEERREEIRKGSREQLCSVLTIAVDRHAVFSFYLLHMLENAVKNTVKNVSPYNPHTSRGHL